MMTLDTIMSPSRPAPSPLYHLLDHDALLSTLPLSTVLEHHDGEVDFVDFFAEKYHSAPGVFYRDNDKIYCRGEEPEVAYTILAE